jgi:hypothetical protein
MRHLHVALSAPSFFAHKRKASKTIGRELELNGVEIARKIASITAESTPFYRHPLCRRLNFQSDYPIEVSTHTRARGLSPSHFAPFLLFNAVAQSQSLAQNERDGLVWSMAHQEIDESRGNNGLFVCCVSRGQLDFSTLV